MFQKVFLKATRARRFRSRMISFCALWVIVLVAVGASPLLAQGTVTMRVDPATRAVPVNGTFTVDIVADVGAEMDPNGLGAYEFDLVYDANYLEVLSANDAGGLGGTGRTVVELGPNINPDGRTTFGAFSHPPQDVNGPSGTVVLATVTLRAKRAGVTTLNLENALLTDTQANAWPDQGAGHELSIENGTVTVVVTWGDFNGDGNADAASVRTRSPTQMMWQVGLSDGTKFADILLWANDFGNEGDDFYIGDFNGDGNADAASVRTRSPTQMMWQVGLSDGTKFADILLWANDFGNEGDDFYVGDFNGDGNADVASVRVLSPTRVMWQVGLSDGTKFADILLWANDFGNEGDDFYVGDFNGDGNADAASVRTRSPTRVMWQVGLSDGTKFADILLWANDFGNEGDDFYVGDFNGDGNADAASVRTRSPTRVMWQVGLSDGTKFADILLWANDFGNEGDDFYVGDFNGDGNADAASVRTRSPTRVMWQVGLSDGTKFADILLWANDFGNEGDDFYAGVSQ